MTRHLVRDPQGVALPSFAVGEELELAYDADLSKKVGSAPDFRHVLDKFFGCGGWAVIDRNGIYIALPGERMTDDEAKQQANYALEEQPEYGRLAPFLWRPAGKQRWLAVIA